MRKGVDVPLMSYVWGQRWVMQCPLWGNCIYTLSLTPDSRASHPATLCELDLQGLLAVCFKLLVYFQLEFHSSIYLFLKMCKTANGALGLVSGVNVLWLSMQLSQTSPQGQHFLTK